MTLRRPALLALGLMAAVAVSACASEDGRQLREPGPTTTDPFSGEVVGAGDAPLAVSGSWNDGEAINVRHTCRDEDISPALTWSGGPEDVASWAVVAEDDDGALRWVVVNLSPETRSLAEGETDPLAVVGENALGTVGWSGPCAEPGETVTVTVSVYALSQVLEAQNGDPAASLLTAVSAAALELGASTFTDAR